MSDPAAPAVLIVGREIRGSGSGRYVSFRLSLPANLHHASHGGEVIDYVETRYSFVEALRAALLSEFPGIELPALDSKRLMGSLSSSVVNQRTRIINNFLRTVQESPQCTTSRPWGEFLRGMKPGVGEAAAAPPTPADLRGESITDRAPPQTLAENPAAVRGLSFGWLLENFTLFNEEQEEAASAPPEYAVEEGREPSAAGRQTTQSVTMSPVRESISATVDSDDEEAMESLVANEVAVVTPRQVMRQEFYNLVQERRGRAVSGAHSTMITSENPGDLEEGENAGNVMQKSLPPLVYEFLGCLFLGLFINLGRVGPMAGHGGLGWSAAGMLNLAFGISGITYSLGHVSGGHLNPMVSLAVFFRRHLTAMQLVAYFFAQLLGFVVSCVCTHYMVDVTDPLKMPHSYRDDSSIDDYEAIAVVGMFSFAICYTVLCCSTSAAQTGNSHYGLAAGMIVSLGMVVSDFLGCGSSLNPSFDAALVFTETIFDPKMSTLESSASFVKEDGEHAMWGPWLVGPTAGAMLAGFVYKYIKITAFTKRNHGCCNTFFKQFAPFMTELLGSYLVAVTFLIFSHIADQFRPADGASADEIAALAPFLQDATTMLAVAYTAIIIAMSYAGGFVSGGHYNPAVTLGVALQGKMPIVSAIIYILFQCAGAFGASTSLWFILDATPVPGAHVASGDDDIVSASYELLFSFFMVFVVLNSVVAKANRGNNFYGMAYGFAAYVAVMNSAHITGGCVNPAIAVGSYAGKIVFNSSGSIMDAISDVLDTGSWVTMGVPMVGALVAGFIYRQAVTGGIKFDCAKCCKKKASENRESEAEGDFQMMNRLSSVPMADAQRVTEASAPPPPPGSEGDTPPSTPQRTQPRMSL